MHAQLINFTPEMSARYLERNQNNRKVTEKNVLKIASDLSNGAWVVNGETIKIAINGNVIDGQHRFIASVRTGLPFQSFAIFDLPPEVFPTVDVGTKRTAADVLSISEIPNATNIASIIKFYIEAKTSKSFAQNAIPPTNEQILNEYLTSPFLYQKLSNSFSSIKKFINTPFMAICKSAIEMYGDHWFDDCVTKIKTGQNLEYGDPCLTLREWATSNKGARTRPEIRSAYVKLIKAMATNSKLKVVRYSKTEPFPTLN